MIRFDIRIPSSFETGLVVHDLRGSPYSDFKNSSAWMRGLEHGPVLRHVSTERGGAKHQPGRRRDAGISCHRKHLRVTCRAVDCGL